MKRARPLESFYTPEPNTGCWLFLGFVDRNGYGQLRSRVDGRLLPAHLAVYKAVAGEHAAEDLDHTCRNRSCVNPAHLEPVSHRENMRRGSGFAGVNARKTHCKRGHEFTPENTIPHGRDGTNRNCRACAELRHRRPLSEAA